MSNDKADTYDDILSLPAHRSATRHPMPMSKRAAQFAPFAALSGYDEAIGETARVTSPRIELSEHEQNILSRRLDYILSHRHIKISIVHFRPDTTKSGGTYAVTTGYVKKFLGDELITDSGASIALTDIYSLTVISDGTSDDCL